METSVRSKARQHYYILLKFVICRVRSRQASRLSPLSPRVAHVDIKALQIFLFLSTNSSGSYVESLSFESFVLQTRHNYQRGWWDGGPVPVQEVLSGSVCVDSFVMPLLDYWRLVSLHIPSIEKGTWLRLTRFLMVNVSGRQCRDMRSIYNYTLSWDKL